LSDIDAQPSNPPAAEPVRSTAPATAQTAALPAERQYFTFTGDGAEYFKIWIVNVLLTIVTLGIYSAWAKVRRLRYFYNNTKFAGSTFDFHGSPIAILKGRIIAVILIALLQIPIVGIVVLLIYIVALPFLLQRSFRFHMANTSYRNLRFNFTGSIGDAYKALMLPLGILFGIGFLGGLLAALGGSAGKIIGVAIMVITVLALYLLGPYLQYRLRRYMTKGSEIGVSPFDFHVKGVEYYVPYAIAFAFMMVLGVLMSIVFTVVAGIGLSDMKDIKDLRGGSMVLVFGLLACFYLAMLAIGPIIISLVQNLVWRGTSLEGKRFHSELKTPGFVKLWMIVTLLTIITLGLYRPFAAVKLAKARVEAVSWTGSADDMVSVLREGNQRATGSEVADLMDVDIGI
jgi:uncharacterized membrane protein YjgN (DUF898 family)